MRVPWFLVAIIFFCWCKTILGTQSSAEHDTRPVLLLVLFDDPQSFVSFRVLAKELAAREAFRVFVAASSPLISEFASISNVETIDLGPPAASQEETQLLIQAWQNTTKWTKDLQVKVYWDLRRENATIMALLRWHRTAEPRNRPSFVIADSTTYGGIDFADELRSPLIILHTKHLTDTWFDSAWELDTPFYVPAITTGFQYEMNVVQRVVSAFTRAMFEFHDSTRFCNSREKLRGRYFLGRVSSIAASSTSTAPLVLVATSFGLERPRPLPPHVTLVGPLLEPADAYAELPPDVVEFLKEEGDGGVVLVYLDRTSYLYPQQLGSLFSSLASFADRAAMRVVWTLDPAQHDGRTLDTLAPHGSVMVIPGPLPLPRLLRHPQTRILVATCDTYLVHEALSAGVPLVGLSFIGEHKDMCARLLDASVGTVVDKADLDARLGTGLDLVVNKLDDFRANASRVARIFSHAGGARLAADRIAEFVDVGHSHLVPPTYRLPLYQRYNVDLLIVLGVGLYSTVHMLRVVVDAIKTFKRWRRRVNRAAGRLDKYD